MMRSACAIAAALLLLASVASAAVREEPDDPHHRAVARVLATFEPGPWGPSDPGAVTERLHGLGDAALPALLLELDRTRPGTREEQALKGGVRTHAYETFERALREVAAAPAQGALRGLRLLGRLAGPEALALAVELAGRIPAAHWSAPRATQPWQEALAGMLSSGADRRRVASALRDLPPELEEATVMALVASGDRELLQAAVGLLTWAERDPGALMAALAAAPRTKLTGLGLAAVVRGFLLRGDKRARQGAALLAARMRATELVPDLLPLLEAPAAEVRTSALDALRSLTGVHLAPKPGAWRDWLDQEESWLAASDLEARLRGEDPGDLARALREAARHPYGAAALAPRVADLLQHPAPGVRLLAISTLQALESVEGVPGLVQALRDEAPGVADAAQRTLVSLTGHEGGSDPAAWEQVLR